MIVPELAGRLDGVAIHVPMLNASLTDLSVSMEQKTSIDEVNDILRSAAEGPLAGVGSEKPLVSADYVNDPRSGIVDAMNDGGRWPVVKVLSERQRIRLCTSTR